jgi:hypothetical protein
VDAPGIVSRVTGLAARIKNHRNYSEAIGKDLGIVGAEQIDDPNARKPILGIDFLAGHPLIRWKKGGASATWKYRAIYHQRDDQVGQWSDVVTITVGG